MIFTYTWLHYWLALPKEKTVINIYSDIPSTISKIKKKNAIEKTFTRTYYKYKLKFFILFLYYHEIFKFFLNHFRFHFQNFLQ